MLSSCAALMDARSQHRALLRGELDLDAFYSKPAWDVAAYVLVCFKACQELEDEEAEEEGEFTACR